MADIGGGHRGGDAERIVQLCVGAVLTLVIGWGANTLADTSRAVATLSVKVDGLTETVGDLKAGGQRAFLSADAAKEFGRVEARILDLEQRVRLLEGKGVR